MNYYDITDKTIFVKFEKYPYSYNSSLDDLSDFFKKLKFCFVSERLNDKIILKDEDDKKYCILKPNDFYGYYNILDENKKNVDLKNLDTFMINIDKNNIYNYDIDLMKKLYFLGYYEHNTDINNNNGLFYVSSKGKDFIKVKHILFNKIYNNTNSNEIIVSNDSDIEELNVFEKMNEVNKVVCGSAIQTTEFNSNILFFDKEFVLDIDKKSEIYKKLEQGDLFSSHFCLEFDNNEFMYYLNNYFFKIKNYSNIFDCIDEIKNKFVNYKDLSNLSSLSSFLHESDIAVKKSEPDEALVVVLEDGDNKFFTVISETGINMYWATMEDISSYLDSLSQESVGIYKLSDIKMDGYTSHEGEHESWLEYKMRPAELSDFEKLNLNNKEDIISYILPYFDPVFKDDIELLINNYFYKDSFKM